MNMNDVSNLQNELKPLSTRTTIYLAQVLKTYGPNGCFKSYDTVAKFDTYNESQALLAKLRLRFPDDTFRFSFE